ncbi:MAG: antibiotic biosynthesis monooxygenase [Actinomycetota bacterium]|nr:antibiotic biosynthesis monooxygenase [Actinomycetota bacterium]
MATFDGVNADTVEPVLENVRERAEQILRELPGWQGATQMLDRRNGKIVVVNFFDSEENMQAAEPTFEEMPRRLGPEIMEQVAGQRRSVEWFEVLAERRL